VTSYLHDLSNCHTVTQLSRQYNTLLTHSSNEQSRLLNHQQHRYHHPHPHPRTHNAYHSTNHTFNLHARYYHLHSTTSSRHFSTNAVMSLNKLRPAPFSRFAKHRVGRGDGSGMGKTSKRGSKGQRARSKVPRLFEGGQTPLWQRTPKRGFKPPNPRPLNELNLSTLMYWIHSERFGPSIGRSADDPITMKHLYDYGVFRKIQHGVKLLARGIESIGDQAIHLEVTDCTIAAKNAIINAGGSVRLVYYNRVALRSLLRPEKYEDWNRPSTLCIPPPKLRAKYEHQLASGEVEDITSIDSKYISTREKMVRDGLVKLKK